MKRPRRAWWWVAFGGVSLALIGHPRAYEDGGHYHTVLRQWAAFDDSRGHVRALEAFCAQLPDLSRELDAKSLRLSAGIWNPRWTFLDSCRADKVAHMALTQFYVHSLTGGSGTQALHAAESTLRALQAEARRRDELRASGASSPSSDDAHCAVGFALHAIGDAFAHQRLGSTQMYPTGEGHLLDGAKPDHPLYPGRGSLWAEYADLLAAIAGTQGAALDHQQLDEIVDELSPGAVDDKLDWVAFHEPALIRKLRPAAADPLGCLPEVYENSKQVCQPVDRFESLIHTCEETRPAAAVLRDFHLEDLGFHVDPAAAYSLFLSTAMDGGAAASPPCSEAERTAELRGAADLFDAGTYQPTDCREQTVDGYP